MGYSIHRSTYQIQGFKGWWVDDWHVVCGVNRRRRYICTGAKKIGKNTDYNYD